MRITRSTVDRLAAEAERVTGRPMIEGINPPGDGRTHYVMAESMTSTYYGASAAAAYMLGVLAGADPDGPVNWVEHRPGWVAEIDSEFRFGEIPAATLRAYQAGTEYGRSHRRPVRAGERRAWTDSDIPDGALARALGSGREDRYVVVVTYEDLTRVHTTGT